MNKYFMLTAAFLLAVVQAYAQQDGTFCTFVISSDSHAVYVHNNITGATEEHDFLIYKGGTFSKSLQIALDGIRALSGGSICIKRGLHSLTDLRDIDEFVFPPGLDTGDLDHAYPVSTPIAPSRGTTLVFESGTVLFYLGSGFCIDIDGACTTGKTEIKVLGRPEIRLLANANGAVHLKDTARCELYLGCIWGFDIHDGSFPTQTGILGESCGGTSRDDGFCYDNVIDILGARWLDEVIALKERANGNRVVAHTFPGFAANRILHLTNAADNSFDLYVSGCVLSEDGGVLIDGWSFGNIGTLYFEDDTREDRCAHVHPAVRNQDKESYAVVYRDSAEGNFVSFRMESGNSKYISPRPPTKNSAFHVKERTLWAETPRHVTVLEHEAFQNANREYQIRAYDSILLVETSNTNDPTLVLPPTHEAVGKAYIVKKMDQGGAGRDVNLCARHGHERIDDQHCLSLSNQYEWVEVVCSGSQWVVVGRGR